MASSTRLDRAEFLKLGAAAAGAAVLGGRNSAEAGVVFADTVLIGGKVVTMDAADSTVQAVAVRAGLIDQVGSDAAIMALAGPATRVLDLRGRTVTPGLIDSHLHFQIMPQFGGFYLDFMPPEVSTIAEMQDKLAAEVARVPAGTWVQAVYMSVEGGRAPTRQELDVVSPDHPVFMMQLAGHFATANSAALAVAGITAATSNPTGGIIERDDHGELTGLLYNHQAMDMVRKWAPRYGDERITEGIITTQPLFAAAGVTSYHDTNIRGAATVADYQNVARAGKMSLRSTLYFTLEYPTDLAIALNQLEHYEDPYCRLAGAKFLIDGQATTFYCHEPHNGVSWQTTTWDQAAFKQAVRALHDAGMQVAVHCGGDAALDLTLDAYEEAMNANPRPDPRHRIEHCILSKPESTQRIKDLGVCISTQPQFIRMAGDYYPTIFGDERLSRVMVTREWLEAGIPVALSSDAPTTPWYQPQVTLTSAQARRTPSSAQVGPEQALTMAESLRAHTITAAYVAHEETVKGSLEPGKLADLVVWTRDPYTMLLKDLQFATVDLTMVGGTPVYQGPREPRRRLRS
jgi:predicted amidohydrolase YtcJ